MPYGTLNAGAITPGSGNTLTVSEIVNVESSLKLAGTAITSTAAELNLLDGSSVTNATVSKAVVLDSSGNIALPNTKGISFAATADGSGTTTSEVLDDYEEGTWTPTPTAVGNGAVSTTTVYSCSYNKVGRRVTCDFSFNITNTNSGTGRFYLPIANLPFTPASKTTAGEDYGGKMLRYNSITTAAIIAFSGTNPSSATRVEIFNQAGSTPQGTITTGIYSGVFSYDT